MRLDSVRFGYGPGLVVRDVSLAVPPGAFLTLLGPSGCGKTTLLKLLGGYLTPLAGTISLRGRDVTALPPEARNAGMVFQHYALFPHLTARANVSFGLEVRRVPAAERARLVEAMLDRVGLSALERGRKPSALSGGQQQRVALARALVLSPDVLLLDEPLANLDRRLRDELRGELRRLQRETRVTTIMVTHDQEEALSLSDLVGVMADGRLLQVGTPAEVYAHPRTPFVAKALGDANLIDGGLVGVPGRTVLSRPERCAIELNSSLEGEGSGWSWPGRVASVSFLGPCVALDVICDSGVSIRVRTPSTCCVVGDRVRVGVPADAVWPIPEADTP